MPAHPSGAARTPAWTPRLVITAVLAALIVAGALVTGLLRPTPTVAEESAASSDRITRLPQGRPAELGEPRDPLSIEEIGYAVELATRALPAGTEGVSGAPGAELLSVDLASMKPDTTERAVAVSFYDYAANRAVSVPVELYAGAAGEPRTATKLQPAPNRRETAYATELLVRDEAGQRIVTEYTALTGRALVPSDLIASAGTYYDDVSTEADDVCGEHRCVQLLLQEPTARKYLSTGGLAVDLTAGTVLEVKDLSNVDAADALTGGN